MEMNVNLRQSASLSQQLNLAPQLLHWLRLLQVPATELSELVRTELEQNPALEITADPEGYEAPVSLDEKPADPVEPGSDLQSGETDFDDARLGEKLEVLAEIDDGWRSEYLSRSSGSGGSEAEDQDRHQFILDSYAGTSSIQELLFRQLGISGLLPDERVLAELIIGSIDGNGYLAAELDELVRISERRIADPESVLKKVQHLGPVGVGARDLRECLLLQLGEGPELARKIVDSYLDALAREQYAEIAAALGASVREVMQAKEKIVSLNPHPGRTAQLEEHHYVTPDAEIFLANGGLQVELTNGNIPHLRLSSSCRRMLESGKLTAADVAYIRNKMRSASFLIQGIRRREDTLKRVVEQIAHFQGEYLVDNNGELKPLTMARIASVLQVHETTVSRALANKYIKTPRGVLPMKHFFQPGYRCADGTAMTPEAVKALMMEVISAEDPAHPVRDVDIGVVLRKRGLLLARRTIAKYRTELGLACSKQRRQNGPATGAARPAAPTPDVDGTVTVFAPEPDAIIQGNKIVVPREPGRSAAVA